MFKKWIGLLVSLSLMVMGVNFSFAVSTPDPKQVELKNLVEERKTLHNTIVTNIEQQKAIIQGLKSGIVKVEETTPNKESVKSSNKAIRNKIKAIKEANATINQTRINLLQEVKPLITSMKEFRTEYKAAKLAKDTAKMSTLLDQMIAKIKQIIANLTQRAEIRTQMTANMNNLK